MRYAASFQAHHLRMDQIRKVKTLQNKVEGLLSLAGRATTPEPRPAPKQVILSIGNSTFFSFLI